MRWNGCLILFLLSPSFLHLSLSFVLPSSTSPLLKVGYSRGRNSFHHKEQLSTRCYSTTSGVADKNSRRLPVRGDGTNTEKGRERLNREFKEKRIQDKLNRQLKKFLTASESDSEIPSREYKIPCWFMYHTCNDIFPCELADLSDGKFESRQSTNIFNLYLFILLNKKRRVAITCSRYVQPQMNGIHTIWRWGKWQTRGFQ